MKTKIFACIAFIIMIIVACSKSSEDTYNNPNPPGGGNNNCDTTNMSYQSDIVPILSANCYACHGENSNSASNGIVLEGHSNLLPKASSGTLVGVITHATGYPAMPQNAGKLSDCNINKIKAWVNAGAQDN